MGIYKMKKWKIFIDRGGTFTDMVAIASSGERKVSKLLSEAPELYKDAAVESIRRLFQLNKEDAIPLEKIEKIKMGTTVATNALLTRNGVKTVFLTNIGFGDALKIGYQNRPNIFDLKINQAEVLYNSVIEISGRINAMGEEIEQLDEKYIEKCLRKEKNKGITSLAVTLLHSYINPSHEKTIAKIAQSVGFKQISLSHETSPLIKYIYRASTTVMDAYLSPVLKQYLSQFFKSLTLGRENLGRGKIQSKSSEKKKDDVSNRVYFMCSSGGLARSKHFSGKDAILSGPAGGVVGMVRTANASGFDKIIGFDMGGTSTDVSHFAGEYEREYETKISGQLLRVPMLHVHTIAAGGGSVLHFKNKRFLVGPDSAGAAPGPACYGKGGPLSITDCHVVLNRILPSHFPHAFGKDGKQPLNYFATKKRFETLLDSVSKQIPEYKKKSIYDLSHDFLTVAIDNMANAIKKITVAKGCDIRNYVLNCFGGASGQLACMLASHLNINKIMISPYASALSAYGIGLAQLRALKYEQMACKLTDSGVSKLTTICKRLSREGIDSLIQQGAKKQDLTVNLKGRLHYEGTETHLEIPLASAIEMKGVFDTIHRSQYGFVSDMRKIVISSAIAEVVEKKQKINPSLEHDPLYFNDNSKSMSTFFPSHPQSDFSKITPVHTPHGKSNAHLVDREKIFVGQVIKGLSIIYDTNNTVVIDDGWEASLDHQRNLMITKVKKPSHHKKQLNRQKLKIPSISPDTPDPVMLEVFNNRFRSIADQMGVTLQKTAYSVNIKERMDFSCAIFDNTGNLIANAAHIPVHLGSMSDTVKEIIKKNGDNFQSGDSFAHNTPYAGGTHLPDITVISPLFIPPLSKLAPSSKLAHQNNSPLFFVASRGHHSDIGGKVPGSCPPDSKQLDEEGIIIDNFLLTRNGKLRQKEIDALLRSGKYPARNPDSNLADLVAQIAANKRGINQLIKLIEEYGFPTIDTYVRFIQDNAEKTVRSSIAKLTKGMSSVQLDHGAWIKVKIGIDKEKREAIIDFTGTSVQHEGNYNAPYSICKSVIMYVFKLLTVDDFPLCEGCERPLKIIIPKGSMLNPSKNAAVIAGNTEVSQAIADALLSALGKMAGSQGTMNNFVYGNDRWQNYETICGGVGATFGHDGANAVHSHMTNTLMTDFEILEGRFPIRVEAFSIRKGSGGAGKWYGGDGAIRKIRFLKQMRAAILSSRRTLSPPGIFGGKAGRTGKNYIIRQNGETEILKGNDQAKMSPGDLFVVETPGGGGFGRESRERTDQ